MEDEHIVHTDFEHKLQLCAVFDGHGGSQCVTYLKENYLEKLYNNVHFKDFLETNSEHSIKNALNSVTLEIDKYMIDTNIKGGSTAIVVIVTPDNIYLSNLGDSRAIVMYDKEDDEQENIDFFATTDQKPSMYAKRITKASGFVQRDRVDGKLAVGNCFGDIHFKNNPNLPISEQKVVAECDITVIKNGFNICGILLGCDGIFDVYKNSEIVNDIIAISQKYTENLAEIIVSMCLLKESTDNLTICISLKRNKKYIVNNTKLFTSETFNFLKRIPDFIKLTQRLTKSQLNRQHISSIITLSPIVSQDTEKSVINNINNSENSNKTTTQITNKKKKNKKKKRHT
jgi:serine/threonine protein phosphatase PrpC